MYAARQNIARCMQRGRKYISNCEARPLTWGSSSQKSLVVEIQRKRFNPPAEPFNPTRAPVVDARRGLGVKETVRPSSLNNRSAFCVA